MSLPGTPQEEASHLEPSGPEPVKPQQFRENLRLHINKAHSEIIFFTLTHESNIKHTGCKCWDYLKNEAGLWTQMVTYSTLHTRDHIAKKKPDDKPCSLEGLILKRALFKCKCRKRDAMSQISEWLKIIWEHIHDPRIQKLCDFGLYIHNSQ